jgi:hypothetical protein
MRESLDIFIQGNKLLDVLILPREENWIIYYYAVDVNIGVGGDYCVFKFLFTNPSEVEVKAAKSRVSSA